MKSKLIENYSEKCFRCKREMEIAVGCFHRSSKAETAGQMRFKSEQSVCSAYEKSNGDRETLSKILV